MKISVILYDKHPVCTIALSTIIKDSFPLSTVKILNKLDDFCMPKFQKNFDLIILDIQEEANVNLLLKQIRKVNINTRIVFFTDSLKFHPEMIVGVGNIQVLGKNSDINSIVSVLNLVTDNKNIEKKRMIMNNRRDKINVLSPRELECASLLMNGYTVGQIAKELSLAFSTISTLKSRIFKKTEVNSLVELTKIFYNFSD